MPRQKNTKPTSIYWLYDVRPETVAAGWPIGKPFYCGKTVKQPERRLDQHRCKRTSKVGARIFECRNLVRLKVLEVVPHDGDWIERERSWIRTLRFFHPDCLNVADGGEGPAGLIFSAESRAKLRASHLGQVHSAESIARATAKRRGQKRTPEQIARMIAGRKNRTCSPEARAKMRAAHLGKKLPEEQRAKISAANKGRKASLETRTKLVEIWKRDRELRLQKMPSRLGITHTPEVRARLSASHKGKKRSPEHRENIRKSWERRKAALHISNLRCDVAHVVREIQTD